MDDVQAIEQRAEKIAQHSEIEYKKDLLKKEGTGKRTQVSAAQVHHELSDELRIVQKAERELAGVKGIKETIRSFETQTANGKFHSARGATYELEKAMIVSQEEPIIGLGISIEGREMDIVTPTRYIECKNIDWNRLDTRTVGKMQSTFGDQVRIARAKNMILEIHSKTKISENFKNWFTQRGIHYFEDIV